MTHLWKSVCNDFFPVCLKRVRKRFWPSCIATWRFMGQCTMRRSVPQRCLPLLRTTVCCLSRSCSSFLGRQRWEYYWSFHQLRIGSDLCIHNFLVYTEMLCWTFNAFARWTVMHVFTWIWAAQCIASWSPPSHFSVKLFIGFGFPYEGPAPLEAIANGCIFLQPKFNPPRSSLNHEFFRGKPTSREVCTLVFIFATEWEAL